MLDVHLAVAPGGIDALVQYGAKRVGLFKQGSKAIRSGQQFGTDEDLQPNPGFTKFLEGDLELMHEIGTGFGALGFGMIRRRRGSASKQLRRNVPARLRFGERANQLDNPYRIGDEPFLQVIFALFGHLSHT